jgi:hypothetical protein
MICIDAQVASAMSIAGPTTTRRDLRYPTRIRQGRAAPALQLRRVEGTSWISSASILYKRVHT